LPSLSGWWRGQDIHWRGRAGHRSAEECAADLELRAEERRALAASLEPPVDPDPAAEVPLDACIGYVGATPAPLVLLPLEDALGSLEQPNLPGPGDAHPNWRRRWPENAAQMLGTPQVDRRLRLLERSRRDAEEAAHD
ncbi:TPA: 4-alpha-glucanotransferase, partial [Pseudomonas aeruginosa]|nr:4-alpha-glucanotransferase [Pseudomonas aeruginosa]